MATDKYGSAGGAECHRADRAGMPQDGHHGLTGEGVPNPARLIIAARNERSTVPRVEGDGGDAAAVIVQHSDWFALRGSPKARTAFLTLTGSDERPAVGAECHKRDLRPELNLLADLLPRIGLPRLQPGRSPTSNCRPV